MILTHPIPGWTKQRRMSCAGNLSRTEGNAREVLVCKAEGKRPQLSRHIREDNIKRDLKEMVTGRGVDSSGWGEVGREKESERGKWLVLVNTVMNVRVPKMRGICSLAERPLAAQAGLCLTVRQLISKVKLCCHDETTREWFLNVKCCLTFPSFHRMVRNEQPMSRLCLRSSLFAWRERNVVRSPQSNDPPPPGQKKRKHIISLRNYFHRTFRVPRTTRRPNLTSGIWNNLRFAITDNLIEILILCY
jgi:hypothetical protein